MTGGRTIGRVEVLCLELRLEKWEGATSMGLNFILRAWEMYLQVGSRMSAVASMWERRLAGEDRWGSEGWRQEALLAECGSPDVPPGKGAS